jgi:hypothetical protein
MRQGLFHVGIGQGCDVGHSCGGVTCETIVSILGIIVSISGGMVGSSAGMVGILGIVGQAVGALGMVGALLGGTGNVGCSVGQQVMVIQQVGVSEGSSGTRVTGVTVRSRAVGRGSSGWVVLDGAGVADRVRELVGVEEARTEAGVRVGKRLVADGTG